MVFHIIPAKISNYLDSMAIYCARVIDGFEEGKGLVFEARRFESLLDFVLHIVGGGVFRFDDDWRAAWRRDGDVWPFAGLLARTFVLSASIL